MLLPVQGNKGGNAPVIRFLHLGRKKATRQLVGLEMVRKTLTAHPFAGTARIGAGTVLKVWFLAAFHRVAMILEDYKYFD
jgi:hypothetical protein